MKQDHFINRTALLGSVLLLATACGRDATYNLDEAETASSTAAIAKGISLCDKSHCPKMEMTLDVEVADPGTYSAAKSQLTLPAGSATQFRLKAKVTDPGVMRAAALLLKTQIPWLTAAEGQAGAITVSANPPANTNMKAEFQLRDMAYCKMKAKKAADCNDPSIPNESDKMVTLNIVSTGTGSTRQNSANNLPPDRRCVQVPPDTQQTAGTLGTIVGIGSALITGNFMPIITNIAGGNNQNPRQGC